MSKNCPSKQLKTPRKNKEAKLVIKRGKGHLYKEDPVRGARLMCNGL